MIRRWFLIFLLFLGLLVCVPLHYLWRLVRARSPWPRRFLWWVGWVSGLRIDVRGAPFRYRNTVFVANHASWLDIMAIGGITGAAFVAKAEIRQWGVVAWLAGLNDSIYVERSDRRAIHSQADNVRDALQSGRAVALFPEATTKGGRDVLPFRASLFSALFPPIEGLVVQPIAIDYGFALDEVAWGDESGLTNVKRILDRRAPIGMTMTFLDPIVPGPGMDRKQLAQVTRERIVAALEASAAAPQPLSSTP